MDKPLGNGCYVGFRPMCQAMRWRTLGGKRDWIRCWYEADRKDGRRFVCRIHGKSKRAEKGKFTCRDGKLTPA